MDPILVSADDQNRAAPASLRSPGFRRMLALTRPHRKYIYMGFVAGVLHAFLHSASIMTMLPVLKVMLADEGLHGWLDRSAAEKRLDARFAVRSGDGEGPVGAGEVVVVELPEDSPLFVAGVRPLDAILGFEVQEPDRLPAGEAVALRPVDFFREVALAGRSASVDLRIRSPRGGADEVRAVMVALRHLSPERRAARYIAELIPREKQREDRIRILVYVLSVVVGMALLSNMVRFFAQYYMAIGVLRAVMDLRRMLYRKVLRLPMDFFARETSDVVSRFVTDAQEIQRGLLAFFGKLLPEPIKAAFLLAGALWLDARMTLTMLIAGPVAITIFWAIGRKIRKANKKLLRSYGVMIGALSTTLQAIGIVKAYNAENVERRRLWRIDRKMFRHQLRIAKLEAFLRPLLEVLGIIGVAGVTVWLGAQVIRQQIAMESFVQLILVLGMIIDPLRKLADVYPRVVRSAAGAQRIFGVVDAPAEEELVEGAVELAPLREALAFRDVTFTYPGGGDPALRHIDLTIRKGETVALVGANGSGKTTLMKLITRFHDPQEGVVLFDGVDVRQANLRSLRRQVALVTQDPVVFGMTIAENIAYGARKPEREAIVTAALRAHADGFIRERPEGYDEVVGERGGTLSGGQRQRLCIARAMMRQAPILIFDEATSQIDSESEKQIQNAVREYAVGRTTILIAHRLSTIRFAQRVIVMERGRILDSGRHEELLERCPTYIALCRTQLAE